MADVQLVAGFEYRHTVVVDGEECGFCLLYSDRDGWTKHGWHDDEGQSLGDVDDTECPKCGEPVEVSTLAYWYPVAECLAPGCGRVFQRKASARVHRWLSEHSGPWSLPAAWLAGGLTLDEVLPRMEVRDDVVIHVEQPSDRERQLHRRGR